VVEQANLFDDEWPGFAELIKTYLRFTRDIDPYKPIINSFDLYLKFFTDLQTAFSNNRGAVLSPTIMSTCGVVIPMALKIDQKYSKSKMVRTSFISAVVLKIFNSIRGERADPSKLASLDARRDTSKKGIIMYISTVLCRLYFRLGQPASCANVFSNIHTAKLRLSQFPKSQTVEYRYYLGRFYLYKCQFGKSFIHLSWAFDNCYTGSNNKRLILKYLIPVSILLGRIPSQELLYHYNLHQPYLPLVNHLKSGNYRAFTQHVDIAFRDWFLERELLVMLKYRMSLLVYRSIIYKLLTLTGGQFNMKFDTIKAGLTAAGVLDDVPWKAEEDTAATDYFIENVCIALVDGGLVKANVFTRSRVLKFSPKDPIPNLATLNGINNG
ncbi:hypothetical protein NADFUDRAFT_8752, partial [Nadsonia fulvescens var. elongata DSM 6958]